MVTFTHCAAYRDFAGVLGTNGILGIETLGNPMMQFVLAFKFGATFYVFPNFCKERVDNCHMVLLSTVYVLKALDLNSSGAVVSTDSPAL